MFSEIGKTEIQNSLRSIEPMSASSVLVAVSGDKSDSEAVKLACEMLGSPRNKLHILYVIEIERGFPLDAEIAPAIAKGEEVLQEMEKVARGYKCRAEAELVQARQSGCAIVQEAVEKKVDSIVVGIPYQQRYGYFSLGDTIPYVLKNAPCQVVIWRDSVNTSAALQHAGHNGNGRPN
jgi:nucleotide-binding universal stress UspA family protein